MLRRIVLIGFMGVGKTAVGEILARKLGRDFIELDAEIEKGKGLSIPDIFELEGEEAFRGLETECLGRVLEGDRAVVVSTGGGIVQRHRNKELLDREGNFIVWLNAGMDALKKRVGQGQGRPKWIDDASALQLLNKRASLYASVADLAVETDDLTPDQVADVIVERMDSWNRET